MCGRDVEEGGYVAQREEREQVGVAVYQLVVSPVLCFCMHVDIAVVYGGIDGFGGVHHYILDPLVCLHERCHFCYRDAVYMAWRYCND